MYLQKEYAKFWQLRCVEHPGANLNQIAGSSTLTLQLCIPETKDINKEQKNGQHERKEK
jgi:hypothetical protein